ncbi:hypothetical protein [Streptomyces longwoodensis]|uniref:hypothetical protein n=1 Tax=Streptomyces longwoodensis TaxID=68231 RepID=UPI00225626AE|nr:hypothetical protein [Streptomyces longwoodensis]MCX4993802.1 hypothetical protein [Streptomyces longwoodensis]MCX4998078.1 hypothetical protein [Streptomyces longwoodensis]
MNVARGSDYLLTADRDITPAERAAAVHTVRRHSRSDEDLHLLLEALDLEPQPDEAPQ